MIVVVNLGTLLLVSLECFAVPQIRHVDTEVTEEQDIFTLGSELNYVLERSKCANRSCTERHKLDLNTVNKTIETLNGARVENRVQLTRLEEPFCRARRVTYYPSSLVDLNNIKRAVLQTEYTRQILEYYKCTKKEQPCRFGKYFPQPYVCIQKRIIRMFVTDEGNGRNGTGFFSVPSCCLCARQHY